MRDPAEAKKLKDETQSELTPEMKRLVQEQIRRQELKKGKTGDKP